MSKIINKSQMREIEKLANNGHHNALIAYGADLYRKGLSTGAISIIVGVTIGGVIYVIADAIKIKKKRKWISKD